MGYSCAGILLSDRRVVWTLIDTSHWRFNIWEADTGCKECFFKGEDPNITKPLGESTTPHSVKELLEREREGRV